AQVRAARLQTSGSRSALATAGDLADYARVTAPFDGVVTERFADPGAFVQSAAGNQASTRGLLKLVADRRLRVLIPVPETDLPSIRKGTLAAIALDAFPKEKFTGTVTRTAASVDPKSRTMLTEVELPNAGGRLRPGMYARVTLTLEVHRGAITIPSEAVMGKEDRFVYVVTGGKAHKTPVQVGVDDGKVAEVTEGLNPGAVVVVIGRDTLVDGASVKTEPVPEPKGK
ncbi:MAG: putative Acriflavine resistance protein acrA, partial [Armatimonadetes bacterium]|nr:putative Acriflavine resistance protein acrA [Armatimonadota bacterium]